jgi:hypothetical protein
MYDLLQNVFLGLKKMLNHFEFINNVSNFKHASQLVATVENRRSGSFSGVIIPMEILEVRCLICGLCIVTSIVSCCTSRAHLNNSYLLVCNPSVSLNNIYVGLVSLVKHVAY